MNYFYKINFESDAISRARSFCQNEIKPERKVHNGHRRKRKQGRNR